MYLELNKTLFDHLLMHQNKLRWVRVQLFILGLLPNFFFQDTHILHIYNNIHLKWEALFRLTSSICLLVTMNFKAAQRHTRWNFHNMTSAFECND